MLRLADVVRAMCRVSPQLSFRAPLGWPEMSGWRMARRTTWRTCSHSRFFPAPFPSGAPSVLEATGHPPPRIRGQAIGRIFVLYERLATLGTLCPRRPAAEEEVAGKETVCPVQQQGGRNAPRKIKRKDATGSVARWNEGPRGGSSRGFACMIGSWVGGGVEGWRGTFGGVADGGSSISPGT